MRNEHREFIRRTVVACIDLLESVYNECYEDIKRESEWLPNSEPSQALQGEERERDDDVREGTPKLHESYLGEALDETFPAQEQGEDPGAAFRAMRKTLAKAKRGRRRFRGKNK